MPETTIDAAIEQVVKSSSDPDALLAAVRGLADALGYQLTAKPQSGPSVGDRVRVLAGAQEGLEGVVSWVQADSLLPFEVAFESETHSWYGADEIEPVVEQDDAAWTTSNSSAGEGIAP